MAGTAGFNLDPGTALFFMSLFGFVMAAICFSGANTFGDRIQGLRDWGRMMLLTGVALLCYCFRGVAPAVITVLAPNVMMLAATCFALRAYIKFFSLPLSPWALPLAAFGAAGIGYGFLIDNLKTILIFVSASAAPLLWLVVRILYKHAPWRRLPSCAFSGLAIGLLALALTVRVAHTLSGSANSVGLFAKSGTQYGFLVASALTIIAGSMGFLLMAYDKHKHDILESARRDGLTGLYTRSAFFESATVLDTQGNVPYSVVMLDIDHFKKINDTYGHASGDVAIIHVARLILRSIRSADIAGRYGGEEFCILLKGCGAQEVATFANRVVEETRGQRVRLPNGQEITFTLSAGYAWQPDGESARGADVTRMLDAADQALYSAKRSGRNKALPATAAKDNTEPTA